MNNSKKSKFLQQKEANNAIFGIWFYCLEIHFLSFFPHFKNPYKFLKCEKQEMWNVTNKKQNFSTIPAIIKFFFDWSWTVPMPSIISAGVWTPPKQGTGMGQTASWSRARAGSGARRCAAPTTSATHDAQHVHTGAATCSEKNNFWKKFHKISKKKLKCPHISTVQFFWNYLWCQMDFWYFQWFICSILSRLYHVSCITGHREASQSHKVKNQIQNIE